MSYQAFCRDACQWDNAIPLPDPPPVWPGGGGTTPPIDPTIMAVVCPTIPSTAVVGVATTIRVIGQNLTASCVVFLDNVAQATTFVSATELTFQATGTVAKTSTIQVRDGATVVPSTCQFVWTAAPLMTVVCPVVPASVVSGAAAIDVLVNGTLFTPSCKVTINGVVDAASVYVSQTQMRFRSNPAHVAGIDTIGVTDGTITAVQTCPFEYIISIVKPILTKIWPDYVGKLDGVAKVVTITGDLFDATSRIMQDLVELPTTFVNAQTLTFTTDPATIVTHSAEIRVQNGAAPNTMLSDNYALFQCVWNVELVEAWPPSVAVGSAPTVIEVTGYGMGNTAEVLMDGVPQPTTWVNGTRCSFVVTPATETARTVQIAVRLGHNHTPEGHDGVMPALAPLTVPFTFT